MKQSQRCRHGKVHNITLICKCIKQTRYTHLEGRLSLNETEEKEKEKRTIKNEYGGVPLARR